MPDEAADRTCVQDHPAAAAHVRNGVLAPQKDRLQIHCHEMVPLGFRRLFDGLHQHNAGVIEEDVQAAPSAHRPVNYRLYLDLIGNIGMLKNNLATLLLGEGDGRRAP